MIRGCGIVLTALLLSWNGRADPALWLVIAGSSPAVESALKVQARLADRWPAATIVSSDDCQTLRQGLYLDVIQAAPKLEAAQIALARLKPVVPDAYVRECRPKPDSRLALGVPLIDPSILRAPVNGVNWTDQDRVSTVTRLPAGGYIWVRRWYAPDPDDPREGRREAVSFFTRNLTEARVLDSDCTDPSYDRRGGWLALSCAKESAADQLLHTVRVFDLNSGKEVFSIRRCRAPRFISATDVSCQAEEIDPDGKLRLARKIVRFVPGQ